MAGPPAGKGAVASSLPQLCLHSYHLLGLGWFSLTQGFPLSSESPGRLCYLPLASATVTAATGLGQACPLPLPIPQSLPELSYLVALQRPHTPAAQSAQRSPPPRTDGGEDTPFSPQGWTGCASCIPPTTGQPGVWLSASPLCFPLLGDSDCYKHSLLTLPGIARPGAWGAEEGWGWLLSLG